MIYTLTPLYAQQLESKKNAMLAYGYAAAAVVSALLFYKFGIRAAGFSAVTWVVAGLVHWKLNALHRMNLKAMPFVQLEVDDERLIYRSEIGERISFLKDLRAVRHDPANGAIELEFHGGSSLQLDGFSDDARLAAILALHARTPE